MTIRIDGTNTTGNPGITGGDADTGLQFGTDEVKIVTGGSERALVDSSGYLRLAGGGIQFGGDTAAANALDDYEEGTWTPIYVPQTGAFTSITYDANVQGFYTKIGNVCYIWGFIRTDAINKTGASGNVSIQGMPFLAKSGSNVNQSISVGYSEGFLGEVPSSSLIQGLQMPVYYRSTSDGDSVILDLTDLSTTANSNQIYVSGVYEVA